MTFIPRDVGERLLLVSQARLHGVVERLRWGRFGWGRLGWGRHDWGRLGLDIEEGPSWHTREEGPMGRREVGTQPLGVLLVGSLSTLVANGRGPWVDGECMVEAHVVNMGCSCCDGSTLERSSTTGSCSLVTEW